MSGSVRIVPHDSPIDKHDHLDIVMNNGNYCVITTRDALVRGYGLKSLDDFHLFLKLGPEPLSDEFNAEYLLKNHAKNRPHLKPFNG